MVDFDTQTRKRCRHCRMRLPEPVLNEREAFCTRGCYQSFYRHRCLACEDKIERTTANRKICKKSKCRNALGHRRRIRPISCGFGQNVPIPQKSRADARSACAPTVGKRLGHPRPDQYSLRGTALAQGGGSADVKPVPLRSRVGRSRRRLAEYRIANLEHKRHHHLCPSHALSRQAHPHHFWHFQRSMREQP